MLPLAQMTDGFHPERGLVCPQQRGQVMLKLNYNAAICLFVWASGEVCSRSWRELRSHNSNQGETSVTGSLTTIRAFK